MPSTTRSGHSDDDLDCRLSPTAAASPVCLSPRGGKHILMIITNKPRRGELTVAGPGRRVARPPGRAAGPPPPSAHRSRILGPGKTRSKMETECHCGGVVGKPRSVARGRGGVRRGGPWWCAACGRPAARFLFPPSSAGMPQLPQHPRHEKMTDAIWFRHGAESLGRANFKV